MTTTTIKQGYKQTDIGIIPEDWDVVGFDVFKPLSTANYSRSELNNTGEIDYLHYGDIHTKIHNFLDFDKVTLPKIDAHLKNNYTLLQDGDLIMADASEDYEGIGKSVEIKNIGSKKAISGLHTFLLRDLNGIFADGYKAYIVHNKVVKSQLDKLATGLKVYGVSKSNLKLVLIPLPPIPEQQAIAAVLTDIDNLITSLQDLIAKKKLIKQGAMQKLLKPQADWEVRKLGEIADIYTGKRNNQDKSESGKYPFFVRSQNIEKINSYSFDGEAILIPGEGNIGRIFHYINGKFDFHQRVYMISKFKDRYFGKYIYRYISEYFGKHAMENSVKATVDSLRLPTFQVFEIPFPPTYGEQTQIATILKDMDEEIQVLESKLSKYRLIKQGAMQELLTGRIRLV